MKLLKFFHKNIQYINFVLITLLIGYHLMKKSKIIEGFDSNVIDFGSLSNLAQIAGKLNAGEERERELQLQREREREVERVGPDCARGISQFSHTRAHTNL